MFNFREWLHAPVYEDAEVIIEEVPVSLAEAYILGVDTGEPPHHLRKYKVTFKSYKSQAAHHEKLHDTEVVYILAKDPQEAKERVADHIIYRKSRMARHDPNFRNIPHYMQGMKRKDMGIRIKEIKTWRDLLDLLTYVAEYKPKYKDELFTHHDLSIIMNKYDKAKDFWADVFKLPLDQQKLLKKFLRQAIQSPDVPPNVKQRLSEPGRFATDQSKEDLLRRGTSNMALFPHLSEKGHKRPDEAPNLHKYSSVSDIIREAKRYGIDIEDLKKRAAQVGAYRRYEAEEERKLWEVMHKHFQQHGKKNINSVDFTNPHVATTLGLPKLAIEIKNAFPHLTPGPEKKELRNKLGYSFKFTTETKIHVASLSHERAYLYLGGTDPANFTKELKTQAINYKKFKAFVRHELDILAQARFQNNPAAFANLVNILLSNNEDTLPAVKNYLRNKGQAGFSPALLMDFTVSTDGFKLLAKPEATITIATNNTYTRITYKVPGGTLYGTTVFFEPKVENVTVKMTNLTRDRQT